MTAQLLLLEDVEKLGRSGDIVTVKPGFARNFLIPNSLAVIADKHALHVQERLQEERRKKAEEDKKASEDLAKRVEGQTLSKSVKVDPEGHMYGSVSAQDIVSLLEELLSITIDKKAVQLKKPIKQLGVFEVTLLFKEDVECTFTLKVVSETHNENEG